MYRIIDKKALNPTVTLMEIEAPFIAKKALPGQFIILRVDEDGERIPLTVADYDRKKGTCLLYTSIYTDSLKAEDGTRYAMFKGLNWIKGIISPHYGQRMLDFDKIVCYNYQCAYGIEDNAALLIENGEIVGSISAGGKAYRIVNKKGVLEKCEL